jgi:hypothetical protein
MTREEFKPAFKRLLRQLYQRQVAVRKGLRQDSHYMNKQKEFITLIDEAIASGWFVMPPSGTRIWSIYYDRW